MPSGSGRAVPVSDVPPGELSAPAAVDLIPTGKRGMPVMIMPLPHGHTGSSSSAPFQGFIILTEENEDPVALRNKWFREMRGWLMVVATVAASVSYQAGLNPPGGWNDDGNPVLRLTFPVRYKTFYYFNATTFVTSLVITVLLMSKRFYRSETKVVALMIATFLDLASLIGAYVAGSTRFMSSCVYVIVITGFAFACVIAMGEVLEKSCEFILRMSPCMLNLAKRNWCPVPRDVVDKATRQAQGELERVSQRNIVSAAPSGSRKQRRPCCLCNCGEPRADDV
uniref:PGG domain-containing protein n=1 Tax=Leersia perrieri TaxID=77586 RepID=A0A0D9WPB6_9ORYZ